MNAANTSRKPEKLSANYSRPPECESFNGPPRNKSTVTKTVNNNNGSVVFLMKYP